MNAMTMTAAAGPSMTNRHRSMAPLRPNSSLRSEGCGANNIITTIMSIRRSARRRRRRRGSHDDDDTDQRSADDNTVDGLHRNDSATGATILLCCARTNRRPATTVPASSRIRWRVIGCVAMTLLLLQLLGTAPITVQALLRKGNLLVPHTYTAGSGDMHVQLHYDPQTIVVGPSGGADVRLQVSRQDEQGRQPVALLDVHTDPRLNITQVSIPCQLLLMGGLHDFEIVAANDSGGSPAAPGSQDERLRRQLDIRWPVPKLSVTPESVGTYPEGPVDVILEFPGVECALRPGDMQHVPEFWLELFYCGHEVYCDSANVSAAQVLYAEQVRGYPRIARIVKLRCELFGLAGHYVVKLRPTGAVLASVSATAYVKADWSEQFVFNVHARSITPCDPHTGIGVLFEYPACILDRADRVRLFAKLRADVASLAPPTTLHYVTEQRVVRGQHSLHFDCELFSEKYIEYCFVYVSQAISGAVADIRMDCLPTLPVSDADVGGWGPWSEWTPCSTTCAGGTKNRYRVCDSPPPRYGAKFCQGDAVETRQCGGPVTGTWECMYGNNGYGGGGGELPADRPEVRAEIGPYCRCGCIVHLTVAKTRRLIASSAESCPGRTFWLIKADGGQRIQFSIDFFRLACPSQYVRVRDGDSLASELIAEYVGGSERLAHATVVSSQSQLLLEFYTNDLAVLGDECKGGFLIHAQQTEPPAPNATIPVTSRAVMAVLDVRPFRLHLTVVHITAILFAGVIILVSGLLGVQYVFRYRKYQLAESQGEPDSPAHTPRPSIDGSADDDRNGEPGAGGGGVVRATSTTTLLSEVQSLIKMRPRLAGGGGGMRGSNKHQRLRESVDAEALAHAADGGGGGGGGAAERESGTSSGGDNGSGGADDADDENLSIVSSHTLTNETTGGAAPSSSLSPKDAAKGVTATTLTTTMTTKTTQAATDSSAATLKRHPKHRPHHHLPVVVRHSTATTTSSMATSTTTVVTDTDDALLSDAEPVSPNTLGSCSPDDADESSPTSSCSPPRPSAAHPSAAHHHHHHHHSTATTSETTATTATSAGAAGSAAALPTRKWPRDKRHNNATGTTRLAGASRRSGGDAETQSNSGGGVGSGGRSRKLSVGSAAMLRSREAMASPNLTDTEGSSLLRTRRLKKLHGRCYSPAGSGSQLTVGVSSAASSTATLRSSAKDSKEKQNRQRLLAGPGSEFSLANPEDFELDYYDYNVINAGAAPGSYLGMDPAYLVWIPPLDGGNIIQEMDNDGHDGGGDGGGGEYDADSDDEEPHYEEIRVPVEGASPPQSRSIHSIETASPSADVAPMLPPLNGQQQQQQQYARQMDEKNQRNSAISKVMAASALSDESPSHGPLIPMKELRSPPPPLAKGQSSGGARIVAQPSEEEKETAVLKSPEPPRSMRTELDDIQFADDVDDDEESDDDGDEEAMMGKMGGGAVVFVDNRSGTVRANAAYYQAPTASTSYASGT